MKTTKHTRDKKLIIFILFWTLALQIGAGKLVGGAEEDVKDPIPEEFVIQQDGNRMYVSDLQLNETWYLNCTSKYQGIFYLYLYNARPESENYLHDHTDYPELGGALVAYNETPTEIFSVKLNETVHTITLEYTAPADALYYLELKLVEGGPDTFVLESNANDGFHEIQAYYIPFIPGYPLLYVLGTALITVLVLKKKRMQT